MIKREIQDLDEKLKNIETMLTSACTQVNITIYVSMTFNLIYLNKFQFDSREISRQIFNTENSINLKSREIEV